MVDGVISETLTAIKVLGMYSWVLLNACFRFLKAKFHDTATDFLKILLYVGKVKSS